MARLPIVGSDDGSWGSLLNAYLEVGHNGGDGTTGLEGTHKAISVPSLSAVTDDAFKAKLTSDTQYRFIANADGMLEWGGGASMIPDTNLYRSAPDTLKTDDTFDAAVLKQSGIAVSDISHTHSEYVILGFSRSGTLAVSTGVSRIYAPGGLTWTISEVRASVNTVPTGASILVDVNKNGTTIFTTQTNRPTIAVSTNTDLADLIQVNSITSGDYLTVDIDQVGSTAPGADLCVQILLSRNN